MKCQEIRELMPDLATGLGAATSETEQHLHACAECAGKLEKFRKTMALLDEWQAPELSPYFDVRLQARLREEMAKPARGLVALDSQAGSGGFTGGSIGGGNQLFPWRRSCAPSCRLTALPIYRCSQVRRWEICRRWTTITICTRISMCWMIWKCSRM